jgi:hypothetical protein
MARSNGVISATLEPLGVLAEHAATKDGNNLTPVYDGPCNPFKSQLESSFSLRLKLEGSVPLGLPHNSPPPSGQ